MDEVHFRELVEKLRFSLKLRESEKWESPFIKHGDIDVSAIRQKYAVSRSELAEMTGVHESDIYAWENDLSKPGKTAYLLLRIANEHPEIFLEVLWEY